MQQPEVKTQATVKRSRLWRKLLLCLGSIIVALTIAEVTARLLGWGDVVVFVPNPDWGFLMHPSQVVYTYGHPVRINALGLRGPELQTLKPAGTKRIVFIGDSVTYGGGRIPEEQLFCRLVEARANHDGFKLEVVNLSAPAWSPQNWIAYIEQRGLHEADLVVLVLPECDLTRVFSEMNMAGHQASAPALRLQSLAMKVVSQFHQERLTARQHPEEALAANLSAVLRLKQKCNAIPLVVVLVPSGVPRQPDEKLWSAFTAHLPDALDLRLPLQDPSYFQDGAHLSVKGHAYVADKVFDKIYAFLN